MFSLSCLSSPNVLPPKLKEIAPQKKLQNQQPPKENSHSPVLLLWSFSHFFLASQVPESPQRKLSLSRSSSLKFLSLFPCLSSSRIPSQRYLSKPAWKPPTNPPPLSSSPSYKNVSTPRQQKHPPPSCS